MNMNNIDELQILMETRAEDTTLILENDDAEAFNFLNLSNLKSRNLKTVMFSI